MFEYCKHPFKTLLPFILLDASETINLSLGFKMELGTGHHFLCNINEKNFSPC